MSVYKQDQLGLIRPEHYNGRYYSQGIRSNDHLVHAIAQQHESDGETVHVVRPAAGAHVGEVALYAAFVQQLTGEDTRFSMNAVDLALTELPEANAPHMSDGEIDQRFAAIKGVNALTDDEQREIIDKALLISAHFWKHTLSDQAISRETRQFRKQLNRSLD